MGDLWLLTLNRSAEEHRARRDITFESDHTNILLIKWTIEKAHYVTDASNYEALVAHFQGMEAVHSTVSRENCILSHWLLLLPLLRSCFSLSSGYKSLEIS